MKNIITYSKKAETKITYLIKIIVHKNKIIGKNEKKY